MRPLLVTVGLLAASVTAQRAPSHAQRLRRDEAVEQKRNETDLVNHHYIVEFSGVSHSLPQATLLSKSHSLTPA